MKQNMRKNRGAGSALRLIGPPGRRGAALVEYVITLGLIAVLTIGLVLATGTEVRDIFDTSTEVISTTDTPGSDTPGPDTPVAELPAPDDCAEVPDDEGTYTSGDWPTAPCFTYRQALGGTYFIFDDPDTRLIYTSGTTDTPELSVADVYAGTIDGNEDDNTMIIDAIPTQIEFEGYGGYDRIRVPGVNFSDIIVDTSSGNLVLETAPAGSPAARDLSLFVYNCSVETVVFDDGVFSIGEILASSGGSCAFPETVDDPSGRPGDLSNPPFTDITDNCIGDASGQAVWCLGDPSRPGDPSSPDDLFSSTDFSNPVNGDACVVDAAGLPVWCSNDDIADLPPSLSLEEVTDPGDMYYEMMCVYRPSSFSFLGGLERKVCAVYDRYVAIDNCVVDPHDQSDVHDDEYLWCPGPTLDDLPAGLTWVEPPSLAGELCAYDASWGVFVSWIGGAPNPNGFEPLACQ